MTLHNRSLPSRRVRLLVAIVASALVVVFNLLPENPLRAGGRILTAAVIFIAYAAYVQLSRNPRSGLPIPMWESVLLGAISGCTIAMLIRFDVYSALIGLGIGAALGLFADRWTAFVNHL